jgi:hypothetical protein
MFSSKTQLWNFLLQNSALEWFPTKLGFEMVCFKTQLWNSFLQNSVVEWFPSKLSFEMVSSKISFGMFPIKAQLRNCFFKTQF